MDTFQIIRQFFTKMDCRFCGEGFDADDIHMVGRGENYFVVAIHCHECGKHNGDAAVGVEHVGHAGAIMGPNGPLDMEDLLKELGIIIEDPELTELDIERFEDLEPIKEDDVLEAHEFIQQLDGDWMKFIPEGIRQRCTATDTE